MSVQFVYHVLITAGIFAILAAGAKFFLKLRGTLDFSYLAIVIFATYIGALLNIERGWSILAAMSGAFVMSLLFTFFVLYLSGKLDDIYFSIGTLALYILCYQLAYNLESVTGGAFGLTSMQRIFLLGDISTLEGYLIFVMVLLVVLISLLMFFKQTYLYTILQGRGEREVILRALGVWVSRYKLVMIILTTLLAVIGGNLYGFYYLYIDPPSFWLPMLILLLVVVFVSYRFNEIGTFLVALVILGAYEGLRFFKIVDPSKIGYLREIIFALIIMIATFRVFRTTKFGRSA